MKTNTKSELQPLENWPEYYYRAEDPVKRKEALLQALEAGLDPDENSFRMTLFEKRYQQNPKTGAMVDLFIHAWLMMKINASSGVSFLQKKRQLKELQQLEQQLCLTDGPAKSETEKQILADEWRAFAKFYYQSCISDETYGSTFFGIVPLKKDTVSYKLAKEIHKVLETYPDLFGRKETFEPLNRIFKEVYCEAVDDGEKKWETMK